jgi:hypothetical protein
MGGVTMTTKWTQAQARSLRDATRNVMTHDTHNPGITYDFESGRFLGGSLLSNGAEEVTVIDGKYDVQQFAANWFGDDTPPSRYHVRDAMFCLTESWPSGPCELEPEAI